MVPASFQPGAYEMCAGRRGLFSVSRVIRLREMDLLNAATDWIPTHQHQRAIPWLLWKFRIAEDQTKGLSTMVRCLIAGGTIKHKT